MSLLVAARVNTSLFCPMPRCAAGFPASLCCGRRLSGYLPSAARPESGHTTHSPAPASAASPAGVTGRLPLLGKKADLAVVSKMAVCISLGSKSRPRGLAQKLVQINGRAGKILLKMVPLSINTSDRPPHKLRIKIIAAGGKMHDPGHQPVHDHGGDRAVPLFQIRRQLGSDRTGGHGVQIVKGSSGKFAACRPTASAKTSPPMIQGW